jgi:ubiquinone/menaquinone biosynthesis C-methylase UbiE
MSVPEFYGRYARLYDAIADLPGVRRWRRAAADALALDRGDTVVEMGCGTGANLPYLRERVGPSGRVLGVDLTRPLLERAGDDDHLVVGDATRPPIGRADAVLGTFVTGMFADPGRVVDGWCDLVRPGGRVALLDAAPSRHPVGRALNPAFRAFARGTAPADSVAAALRAALGGTDADAALDRRVRAGRAALTARTRDRRFESHALGFVGLLSGRVEE